MRKLVVGTFMTLDGVMQAPGGPDEDREGGFRHGGWLVPFYDEHFAQIMTEWTTRASAFVLGRKTYEMFAGSWPNSTDPGDETAIALNTLPKFVASRTVSTLAWHNSHLLHGDVAEAVANLKAQQDGEIQVHGSGDLLQTLFRHDLVDTLRIWLFPVVLGSGKRLFGDGAIPRSFRLVDSAQTATGAVLHVYERAGEVRYGEVEVGQETVVFEAGASHRPIRVEKHIVLDVPVSRVWRALTDHREFGEWFGVALDGPFVPGQVATGRILHPGYEHVTWTAGIRELRPESLFSFSWHPYAVDADADYSHEPPTHIEFRLAPTAAGTRLTVTESGFEHVPAGRREVAYRMNDTGWTEQMKNIERHIAARA